MNTLENATIRAPSDTDETGAKLTIDDILTPFIFHAIARIGEPYTLSFYIKAETEGEVEAVGKTMAVTTEWTRFVASFVSSSVDVPIYFNTAGTYYMFNCQLEIGNKVSDWRPAAEDTDVTTAKMMAAIELSKSEILSTVSYTYALQTEVDDIQSWRQVATQQITKDGIISTVGSYYATSTELSAAESKITQNAANIELKVAKAGVISAINQSAETITINASKINLQASDIVNIIGGSSVKIAAANIDLSGYVTAIDLATAGKTTIVGDNITSGTITGIAFKGVTGDFTGTVTATAGKIGLWSIGDGITYDCSTHTVSLLPGTNGNKDYLVVYNKTEGTWPFYVRADGTLYTSKINAAGGKVGGWEISASRITSGGGIYFGAAIAGLMLVNESDKPYMYVQNSSGTGTFSVDRNGYVKLSGDITATSINLSDSVNIYKTSNSSYVTLINQASENINFGLMYSTLTTPKLIPTGGIYTESAIRCVNEWFRTEGNCGWHNDTYGGGWYMKDTNYVRAYGNKCVYSDAGFLSYLNNSYVGQFRAQHDNYTFIIRNDDNSTYFLLTNQGDALGTWNSLRPFTIMNSTGAVIMHDRAVVPPSGAAAIRGNGDNAYSCGHTSYRFTYVYAASGVSTTSDEREKDILSLDLSEMSDFFMSLEPIAFRWKYGNNRKIHIGVGAQTTERKMIEAGYDPSLFDMIQHDDLEERSVSGLMERYGINYQDLNMFTMMQTQKTTREFTAFVTAFAEWKGTVDVDLSLFKTEQDTLKEEVQNLKIELALANQKIAELSAKVA